MKIRVFKCFAAKKRGNAPTIHQQNSQFGMEKFIEMRELFNANAKYELKLWSK